MSMAFTWSYWPELQTLVHYRRDNVSSYTTFFRYLNTSFCDNSLHSTLKSPLTCRFNSIESWLEICVFRSTYNSVPPLEILTLAISCGCRLGSIYVCQIMKKKTIAWISPHDLHRESLVQSNGFFFCSFN